MEIPVWTVDAFTQKPFSGNPAAVCLLQEDLPDTTKQAIASEMNISETCFVTLPEIPSSLPETAAASFQTSSHFGLRWFTPTNEVPLCGHATLAAAVVLMRAAGNRQEILHFSTLSGTLTAQRDGDRVALDLPLHPPLPVGDSHFSSLVKEAACGLPVKEVLLCKETCKLLVRLEDGLARAQLEAIRPHTERLAGLETSGRVKGVILTLRARPEDQEDFFSRYFAPWNGIPEDPVTGSAHTVLAPYWAAQLATQHMLARQVSPRGGQLHLCIKGSRLQVSGDAVLVLEGKIHLPLN